MRRTKRLASDFLYILLLASNLKEAKVRERSCGNYRNLSILSYKSLGWAATKSWRIGGRVVVMLLDITFVCTPLAARHIRPRVSCLSLIYLV